MITFPEIDIPFRAQTLNDLQQRFDPDWLAAFTSEHGTPALIFDQEQVDTRYEELQNAFPRIKHFFAIKPLPLAPILESVAQHDGYVDVASQGEIDMARAAGFTTARMIHTNPHRKLHDIKQAIDSGVRRFVFDSPDELEKFIPFKSQVMLLLRLSFPNDLSQVNLSYKFGIEPQLALGILKQALDKGLSVDGVSMHVGSQSDHTELFVEALEQTATFIADAQEQYQHTFNLLDIGGGFPAPTNAPVKPITLFAQQINPLLEKYFSNLEVISEPGRYVVNSSLTLVTSIVGKSIRKQEAWYFIDDGLYGSFSGILFDFSSYVMFAAKELTQQTELMPYIIGGPTCDSHDIVHDKMLLPDLEYGDILLTPNIGAYSWTHSTNFNLIPRPPVFDRSGKRLG